MHRHCFLLFFCTTIIFCQSLSTKPEKEDWATPRVDRSVLKPITPTVGSHDTSSGVITDLVSVQWRPHDPIYLHLAVPKSVSRPPVILYLYNYDSDLDRFQNQEFITALTAHGVAAVGFSPALSGQRFHDRSLQQWFVSELQESLACTSHDVQMIIDYLQTRADIDASRVGVFGVGSGGAVAILAAWADPRIKAIALINPWGDWPDWVRGTRFIAPSERAAFDNQAFLQKIASLDPVRYLPQLKIPITLEYLNNRNAVPEAARTMIESSAPSQTEIISPERALADYQESAGTTLLDRLKANVVSQATR